MKDILQEERFSYVTPEDKAFIVAFDNEMARLGYDFGGKIGSGYCFGRHMVIYTKAGAKSPKVYARIYFRDTGIVLRMFLNQVDQHTPLIEKAPAQIKEVFTGGIAKCIHDKDDENGHCKGRTPYLIDGERIEKCGPGFEFFNPAGHEIKDYISLFSEFFVQKRARAARSPAER